MGKATAISLHFRAKSRQNTNPSLILRFFSSSTTPSDSTINVDNQNTPFSSPPPPPPPLQSRSPLSSDFSDTKALLKQNPRPQPRQCQPRNPLPLSSPKPPSKIVTFYLSEFCNRSAAPPPGDESSPAMSTQKEHLVEKNCHADHMSSLEKMRLELQKVGDESKMSESNCGSAHVQAPQRRTEIKPLSMALHKKMVVAAINEQGSPFQRSLIKELEQGCSFFRLGSWNVGTLSNKTRKLVKYMTGKNIGILCLQQVKWDRRDTLEMEDNGYKVYFSGFSKRKNGVGVIVSKKLKACVDSTSMEGDRIIKIKLVIGGTKLTIVSAYAPQVGLDDEEKKKFWDQMVKLMQGIPSDEKVFVGGNFNGHVGNSNCGYENVHGGFGFGHLNNAGKRILNFGETFGLIVINTFFKKKEEQLITFESGSSRTQVDYFLVRDKDRSLCIDCQANKEEHLVAQHRVVILDTCLKGQHCKDCRVGPRKSLS